MINIVADKDIPYLDEVFKDSKFFNLKALPFNEINKKVLKNSQGLLSRSATILNEELINGSDLKFIFSLTSGEDHIDYDFLNSKDIFVKSAKGSNAQAVLEYSLNALNYCSAKKIGLIGEGHVGTKIKKVLSFFDYEVISYDPYKFQHDTEQKNLVLNCPLISVNASYSKEGDFPSHKLISNLKNNQSLINTSRGEVVDYKNILEKSDAKLICDVWNNEPKLNKEDIEAAFIATPHIAGNTLESKLNALNLAINALKNFFESNDLENLNSKEKFLDIDDLISNAEFEKFELPLKFINNFINIRNISESFKKDLNMLKNNNHFPEYFQSIRKENERLGFGDFILKSNRINSDDKEILSLLGFKIQGG